MIGANRLPAIAANIVPYGKKESYRPTIPAGLDPLPDEWKEKLHTHTFDAPVLYEINDVELAGPNLAGYYGRELILQVGYYGRLDLFHRNAPYLGWSVHCMSNPPERIPLAFSMGGVWSGNYFHWVVDHLPTLAAWQFYSRETGEKPTIILPASTPRFAIESLGQLHIPWTISTGHHYFVDRLIVPSPTREEGFVRPGAINWLRSAMTWDPSLHNRKLYISRRNALTRRLENEEEVTGCLLDRGFGIALMEKQAWKEQLRLVGEADIIVGPHGAGLVNMIFSDAAVVEFVAPSYTNPCCWLIAEAMGLKYGYVVCEQSGKDNIKVPLDKLENVLELMK